MRFPRMIGPYRLEREIAGGMGIVYLAHDVCLERMVALKALPTEVSSGSRPARAFLTGTVALDWTCGAEEVSL